MRLTDIIRDANSNLLRSKARTILTIIAIFIGALTLTITNGIGAGVSSYIDKQLGNLGAEDVLVVQQTMEATGFGSGPQKYDPEAANSSGGTGGSLGFSLPLMQDKDIQAVLAVDGINSAEPLLNATPDFVVGPNGEKYQMTVTSYISGTNLELSSGKLPNNDSTENELTLPSGYSSVLGFSSPEDAVGQEVTIGISTTTGQQREVVATVVGVQEDSLINMGGANLNDHLMLDLSNIQLEGQSQTASGGHFAVIARMADTVEEDEIEQIKSQLKEMGYDAATFQDSIGTFKQVVGAIVAVLNFFAIIALVAASFGIVNTLLMAVQERTKEIGLMKAMGLGGGKIFLLFSVEAILLGFWGSLLGSLAGIGIGQVVNLVASDTFLKDLPGFNLTIFSPLTVAVIMLIIMAISFVAGTVPARRASKKNPIEALRYE